MELRDIIFYIEDLVESIEYEELDILEIGSSFSIRFLIL